MYKLWWLVVLFFIVSPARAEDNSMKIKEVVISATKVELPVEDVASSVTIITEKDLKKKQTRTVAEALKDVPGLDVVQSGSLTNVYIRGTNSGHTLVLIDGVEVNDPVSPSRGYDYLSTITSDNIERIEIIRGPQSTLYGSDAMGGVINIITKKGKGKPKMFISGEGGAHKTYKASAGISGSSESVNFSLAASKTESEGISIRNGTADPEKDGFHNSTFSSRIGFEPSEHFGLEVILRYVRSISDLDNSFGVLDDPNYILKYRQRFLKAQASLITLGDVWEQTLGFSVSDHKRLVSNERDADHPSDMEKGIYEGLVTKIDWQNNIYLNDSNIITAGFEYEKESGKSDYYSESAWGPFSSTFSERTSTNRGVYLQEQFKYEKFNATAGFRHDGHSKFGTKNTYRLTSSYTFPSGTRIKGSFGTGFKAPSLFQLYAPIYGDDTLKPEKSKGLDVGIEQEFCDNKARAGVTYFYNSFKNLIEYDYVTSKYQNISGARTRGLESFISYDVMDELTVKISHTYTDTIDKNTGVDLIRRPAHKMTFDGVYQNSKTTADLSVSYVGRRDDINFATLSRITLLDYFLVNIAVSHEVTENVILFGRIKNLFAESYEEAFGYNTPGLSAFG